jgi:hypothetical protein
LIAALGDLLEEWPVDPAVLDDLTTELGWYRWDAFEPEIGWSLQLAITDPTEGVAWAINAQDQT